MYINHINRLNILIDTVGVTFIGIISFAYCLFWSTFAKFSIELPFLPFPIFIGEISLFICLIILILKWLLNKQEFRFWHYVIFVYFLFIIAKAIWGYLKWGPLALRHATLFFYPLFALFSYYFFRNEYFKDKPKILLLVAVLFISTFIMNNTSTKFMCFILSIIVLQAYPKNIVKYALFSLIFLFTPYKSFLQYYRTMIVSNVVSVFFIVSGLLYIIRIKRQLTIILSMLVIVLLWFAFNKIAPKSSVQSIVNLRENIARFKLENKKIAAISKDFIMYDIKHPKLYRKSNIFNQDSEGLSEVEEKELRALRDKICEQQNRLLDAYSQQASIQQLNFNQEPIKQKPRGRNIDANYGNNLFRIFVWRDLLEELWVSKPFFGFDFGKPFRSRSIEILNMANGEWTRDGWIAVHNSYLETIYRSGVVGILLILTLLIVFFNMIKIAISRKSVNGILLCGILLNWLVSANFMLIFELPYKAIPFWSCFGMTLRYLKDNVKC